jgi:hypothetical protein
MKYILGVMVCCAKAFMVYSPIPLVAPTNTTTIRAGRVVDILEFEASTSDKVTMLNYKIDSLGE